MWNIVASTLQNLYMLPIRVSRVYSVVIGIGPVDFVGAEINGDAIGPVYLVSRDNGLIMCAVHPGAHDSRLTG